MLKIPGIFIVLCIINHCSGYGLGEKLIIDTDGAFDDIRALTLALTHKDTNILAITTTRGGVTETQSAKNVDRILRATKQTHIPIYIGSNDSIIPKGPLVVWEELYGSDGIGGVQDVEPKTLEDSPRISRFMTAIDAIIELSKLNPDLTMVCIGPLTNLARAIQRDPSVVGRLGRVIVMGGNYLGIGNTQTNSTAEFNFLMDPEAAEIVLRNIHCTLIPWDTSFLKGPEYSKQVNYLESLNFKTPLSKFLKAITHRAREFNIKHGQTYAFVDDIAVAVGIEPKIAQKVQKLYANVELTNGTVTRGQVVIDWLSTSYNSKNAQFEAKNLTNKNGWLSHDFVTAYDVRRINKLMVEGVKRRI
ncbi:unnamed protein product [Caenorhabditis angaria]|uniref:Inosine/uridine-preferring nucleoside hydrolase domain-containing protein n=1 Tax=Caenorhabditis angaria TaxID=860376 RepID=A0A9P1I9G0_9PELO|nr:unnamed protein product [Caenorhabditis angaria]